MKLATLALAIVAAIVEAVSAQAQNVRGIQIVEHGIYTAGIERQERGPDGLWRNVLGNICHVSTTTNVPAKLGLHFGFRYRLIGLPEGQVVELRKITLFPVAMMPPGATQPITRSIYSFRRTIGPVTYTGYGFDEASELIPGTWSFQIWQANRMLAEQNFEIVEGPGEPLPSRNDNCFRISSL